MTGAASAGSPARTGPVYGYFGPLTLLLYLVLPDQYLVDIATSYMLKNQLHATATEVSLFRLVTALPAYLAFAFGLARDLWSPLGRRDPGYFLLFAPLSAAVFAWLAFSHVSYPGLVAGMLLVMVASRFVNAAYQGLLALVGQEQLMSGRLSALWNFVQSIPQAAGAFASGYLTVHLSPAAIFGMLAVLWLLVGAFGWWKPRAVFRHTYDRPQARGAGFLADVRRLLRHRAVYPAVLIMLMFQFSPGSNTPLQFYLTDELHGSDAAYSNYMAIFLVSFLPMYALYGYLCRRVSLEKLLWWGAIIAVPQMLPLALVHSVSLALWLAIPIGLMGGIAFAAINDLAIRSCPPGLQGTLMMLVAGAYQFSYRAGDLLGAWIYNASPAGRGFLYCTLVTSAVYALILPVLLLIPRHLIRATDGEVDATVEHELLAEVARDEAPRR
jgi:MFS family permease